MKELIRCLVLFTIIFLSSCELISSSPFLSKEPKIPDILKKCHKNDPNLSDCIRNVIESVRANLSHGIPELLIPPCEPLEIPVVRLKQNAGAIRLESEYSRVNISGLSNFTLRDIYIDPSFNYFRAELWFPILQMTSNYMMQGKLLLMPIYGNGTASGNFTDVDATLTVNTDETTRNTTDNNTRIGNMNVEFNIGDASVKLDNLFNGDPELGSMMNLFLNSNWKEITAEIRPALAESIERILYGIVHQLNEMYKLDEFLEN